MPIYSYRCENDHHFTELVKMDDRKEQPCPECGVTAPLRITPVRLDVLSMGLDPAFPSASDKWAKLHEDQARHEEKFYAEHGEYGNNSPGA